MTEWLFSNLKEKSRQERREEGASSELKVKTAIGQEGQNRARLGANRFWNPKHHVLRSEDNLYLAH